MFVQYRDLRKMSQPHVIFLDGEFKNNTECPTSHHYIVDSYRTTTALKYKMYLSP